MRVIFPVEPKAFRRFPQSTQRLGIMMLSSMLKRYGFKVELCKATIKDLREKLEHGGPAILAYSLVSQLAEPILTLNKEIKKRFPMVKSFVGGPHATYYPEVIEGEGVDGICLGEGDHAIVDLATRIRDGQDCTDLKNWYIKKDGKVFTNELRPVIWDLDILPFADREIMRNNYVNSIMASRGCPYQCTYCLNAAYNRLYKNQSAKIRQRTVDNVIEELKQIRALFPGTFIAFLDTILPVRKDWTEEFSRKYRKYIGIPFFCNIKAEITDKEIVKLLKEAGCYSIGLGIESSDEEIRRTLMKRSVTNEKIVAVANSIHEAGIKLQSFNILGMPRTTFFDDIKTLEFNALIKSDCAVASVLSPYKGTEIYEIAKSYNLLCGDSKYDRGRFSFPLIDYGSEVHKRKLINLESLYPILVRYPWLSNYADFLTKFPLSWLYTKLFGLWSVCVYRWRILPPRWLRRFKARLRGLS